MSFALNSSFVDGYKTRPPPFGFNGLGELVYRRTYSRLREDGTQEEWYQTVERVVNGTYRMQERWIVSRGLGWNEWKAQRSAEEMYECIFMMKFLPPGRGLWAMGSELTEKRKMFAALNNCAFVSTQFMSEDPIKPFTFLMDMSMLGVGVGFDLKGVNTINVNRPYPWRGEVHTIEDSREGWVKALEVAMKPFFSEEFPYQFNYDQLRPYGAAIKGFGGVASGPEPLKKLLIQVVSILNRNAGSRITLRTIMDIQNVIGCCVIAGNVRRTAEIAFGEESQQEEFMNLKNYQMNPDRAEYGWASNNSVFCRLGMNYEPLVESIQNNGEPGFAWLSNMRCFGKMTESPEDKNFKDERVRGGNPCLEQSLESFELCCLVETFPANHGSMWDYLRTLKFAYLYAKTVTLGETHWPETNRVMLRNRRIGCSISGIAQVLAKNWTGGHGVDNSTSPLHQLKYLLEDGYYTLTKYDKIYSDWFCIPRSIKMTSIKPSGTVSLLAGATPGMHYPESEYYIRRVRISATSPLLPELQTKGYKTEVSVTDPNTMIVEFPQYAGHKVRTIEDVTMWEQLELAAFLQEHWADNQVSCTVTFTPEEGKHIANALNFYQYRLKGVSFLPKCTGSYAQMPYEKCTEAYYNEQISRINRRYTLRNVPLKAEDQERDVFCDGTTCGIVSTLEKLTVQDERQTEAHNSDPFPQPPEPFSPRLHGHIVRDEDFAADKWY